MSQNDFAPFIEEHRRLVILRVLTTDRKYRANDSMLYGEVNRFGVTSSRDQVRSSMHWLAEQGLVRIEDDLPGGVCVATLTTRGHDVASGLSTVPGVKRPGPED